MNITLELYNLIWNFLFSGELPATIANIAEELCSIITIMGITIAVLLPICLCYGFIKWIFNFIRR